VVTVLGVALVGLGPLGDAGATLGVLSSVAGLLVEGVFLERVARTQVMPVLPESGVGTRAVVLDEGVT
jgi:hypothetical protein